MKEFKRIYYKLLDRIFLIIIGCCFLAALCFAERVDELGFAKAFILGMGLIVIGLIALFANYILHVYYDSKFDKMTAEEMARIIHETEPCKYCVYKTDKGCLVNSKKCEEGITKWLNT